MSWATPLVLTSNDSTKPKATGSSAGVAKNGKVDLVWSLKSCPKAQLWECGENRKALRHELNLKEMDAAKLIEKYDRDQSRSLESAELEILMQDFNGGFKAKVDEVKFIMKVADVNKDQKLSENEVQAALRIWFAYKHMPNMDEHMSSLQIESGSQKPTEDVVRKLMEILNDDQQVKQAEVQYVLSAIDYLSAKDDTVTKEEMSQAIACWYLHIKRGETSKLQLAKHAFKSVNEKLADLNVCKKFREGHCDFKARGTLILMSVALVLLIFIPLMNIMVARNFPSSWHCEQPILSNMLWYTGVFGLLQAGFLLLVVVAQSLCPDRQNCNLVCCAVWATFLIIFMTLQVVGASIVSYTTAAHCGYMIWHYTHFVYIEFPVFIVVFACCGVPGLYCYLGSEEFIASNDLDSHVDNVA